METIEEAMKRGVKIEKCDPGNGIKEKFDRKLKPFIFTSEPENKESLAYFLWKYHERNGELKSMSIDRYCRTIPKYKGKRWPNLETRLSNALICELRDMGWKGADPWKL